MKKLYVTLLSALVAGGASAQTLSNDRMVVTNSIGQTTSYAVDRIQSVTFPQAAGEAAVDLSVNSVDQDKAVFTATRNAYALSFKFDILTKTRAGMMSDEQLVWYIDTNTKMSYTEDFTSGEVKLSDFGAKGSTDYVAVAVGYDSYGTPCAVSRAEFTTLPSVLVGDPKVTAELSDIQDRSFSLTSLANDDVAGYATLSGEKGSIQQQFVQWAPMMGYSNFSEMVQGWGYKHEKPETAWESVTDTWSNMQPGTDYQIFVQAWDTKGNFAPCDTINLTTKVKGGQGAATVSITLGDYKLADWEGQQKYSQFITFTPNDQSNCYRMGVYTAEEYDKDPEGCKSYITMDPPMPMSNWFFYEPLTTDYQINPNTKAVALAAAKNANNEWGEVEVLRFTTPSGESGTESAPAKGKIATRKMHNTTIAIQPGRLPKFAKFGGQGIQLIQTK